MFRDDMPWEVREQILKEEENRKRGIKPQKRHVTRLETLVQTGQINLNAQRNPNADEDRELGEMFAGSR